MTPCQKVDFTPSGIVVNECNERVVSVWFLWNHTDVCMDQFSSSGSSCARNFTENISHFSFSTVITQRLLDASRITYWLFWDNILLEHVSYSVVTGVSKFQMPQCQFFGWFQRYKESSFRVIWSKNRIFCSLQRYNLNPRFFINNANYFINVYVLLFQSWKIIFVMTTA